MAVIRSFRELKVWQKSMDAAMRVFELLLAMLSSMAAHRQQWTTPQ